MSEAHLSGLPDAAARYLRFMGVVGRVRDWSFRARIIGRFRMKPGQGWMPCSAWQYNSALEVGRVFHVRVRMAGVAPMIGRDTYLRGRGRMVGKLLGVVTVVDGRGPEFDRGEMATYLNDMVLLAPSALFRLNTTWSAVDDESFDLTLSDAGHTVTARVVVDERGAVQDFSTMDKFASLPGGLVRARWHTPVSGWEVLDGHPFPLAVSCVYDLPEGPFCYLEGRLRSNSVAYNVAPGS